MSGTPTISVDSNGNSYVSIGVTDTSNQRVNLTTVKRGADGTLAWTQANTISIANTGDASVINNLYHYLHDNPDKITSVSNTTGPVTISITFALPEAVYFAKFQSPLPSADYLKISAGAVTRSLPLTNGVADVSGGIHLRSDTGTDAISGGIAIFYLGNTVLTTGTFDLDVWFEGAGGATLTKNKATLSALSFAEYGNPSEPRTLLNPSAGAKSLSLSWTAPEYADISNNKRVGDPGAPAISSYRVVPGIVSSSRYPSASYSGGTKTSSTTSYSLTGLYPATTYSIAVSAVNSGGKEGAAVSGQFTTAAPTVVPKYLDSAGTSFITSDFSSPIYAIGNASALSVPVLRVTGGKWTKTLATPIGVHHAGNIGSTASGIMTFTSTLGGSSNSLTFKGFESPQTAQSSSGSGWALSGTPADISSGVDGGYYLQVAPLLSYTTASGVSGNQSLILSQSQAGVSGSRSVTVPVQWDVLDSGVSPSMSAGNMTVTPDSSLLKTICGVKYFGGDYGFTVSGSSITGMGSHHHLANPVIVTIADASSAVTTLSSTSSFSGAVVSKTGSTTYYVPEGYSATVYLRNLNNLTSSTTFGSSLPVIDPASVNLWMNTSSASAPALGENSLSYGQRVQSIGLNVSSPTITAFPDTTIDLRSGDGTREAMLAKEGYFCCPGFSGAYINYPGSGSKDYSGITTGSGGITSGYRYATFRWSGQTLSPRQYSYLKIQIETAGNSTLNINETATTNTMGLNMSNKLRLGTDIIDIYYGVTYTGGNISWSGWIDANSVSNNGNFQKIKDGDPVYTGVVGGQSTGTKGIAPNIISLEPSESGNIYTFYVDLPGVTATSETNILVAVGGKSVASNGLGFKVQATYAFF